MSLLTLASTNLIVCGGGCFETQLCMRLIELKHSNNLPEYCKYIDTVIFSLLHVVMAISKDSALLHNVDTKFHHHWLNQESSVTCCCGAVTKSSVEYEFISFPEILNSPSESLIADKKTVNNSMLFPNIVHVEEIYIHNLRSAFELANLVLRIGMKVILN